MVERDAEQLRRRLSRVEDDVLEGDELQGAVVPPLVDEHLGIGLVERRVEDAVQADHVHAHGPRARVAEVGDARLAEDVGQLDRVPGGLCRGEVVEGRSGLPGSGEPSLGAAERHAGERCDQDGRKHERCSSKDHLSSPWIR